ncbi:MAG: tyrosine-type recombinase/integrase [Anaerovoracaceae bacterium]|jgi:site-specific recombinase XerD|nr:tyrosine-type recombinase/integrase [Anaerovoracaceae bacterium]
MVEKQLRIHNKSDRPDNIIMKENEILDLCQEIQEEMPKYLGGYFAYLKGNVLPLTRLAYLRDVKFFLTYLLEEVELVKGPTIKDIKLEELDNIKAKDINQFIEYLRRYKVETEKEIIVYENANKSLARKKSSLSVFFKYLFRDELISKNITDGLDPIRVAKPGEKEIKALQDDEVMIMLDVVTTGNELTKKEREFWEKTKYRDKAILLIFLTYGLRLSELQQLNLTSFNFGRGEFKIYRKRGKESIMPLNKSVGDAVKAYIDKERISEDKIEENSKDALFLSLQNRRMTDRQIRELVKKYTSYGLKTSHKAGYSPHKLRATAATSLIGRGNSIFDVQALLDHEQVTTTQLYAAHKMNTKRDLVKGMEWESERREGKKEGED